MQKHIRITIKSYDKTVDEYTDKVKDLHPYNESKFFLYLLNRKSRILDLGCGSGRDSKIFSDNGHAVVGIDLSGKMIKIAKKSVKNAKFKVMDIMKLNFKSNSFDGVWANASLVHIRKIDIIKIVKKCHKILKKNGIFYLSLKEGQGEFLIPDERYGNIKKFWSLFKREEMEKILKEGGFKIMKSYVKKTKDKYATHPWISIFCGK